MNESDFFSVSTLRTLRNNPSGESFGWNNILDDFANPSSKHQNSGNYSPQFCKKSSETSCVSQPIPLTSMESHSHSVVSSQSGSYNSNSHFEDFHLLHGSFMDESHQFRPTADFHVHAVNQYEESVYQVFKFLSKSLTSLFSTISAAGPVQAELPRLRLGPGRFLPRASESRGLCDGGDGQRRH